MKFLLGLIMIAVAILFIVKTEWFIGAFGRIGWAEEKLGAEGGTRLFYKLLGVLLVLMAFMIMSGKITNTLDWLFLSGTVQQ
jgi:hypothetical protein